MEPFGTFYLDKEKDIIVDLSLENGELFYVLRTPNHTTGNLIRNLAKLCNLHLSKDDQDLLVIRGTVPSYFDTYNRLIYIFRLGNTKVANIYPDGRIEMKAAIPSVSKTLMSQTKHYTLDIARTIVKTYIRTEVKFHSDLHTHMNANLAPDILIALGIMHQIRYPLYYIKKLHLRLTTEQMQDLVTQRRETEKQFQNSMLTGKYLNRRIDDNTSINFARLILENPENSAYNIARIRTSLAVLKDGQAVFSNLEKVYLYRYVFTKGIPADTPYPITSFDGVGDPDVVSVLKSIQKDRTHKTYKNNTLFQDKLLWIARSYAARGITYAEISDTSLVKPDMAPKVLEEIHAVMPSVTRETGVTLRFLAAVRRIPLTIVRDSVTAADYLKENLRVLHAVADDPYVAGCDIVGEEINDIRELAPFIREVTSLAQQVPSFVIRIHAGENDSLRDNVANSIACVKNALRPGQEMPQVRIGHGLYTANLSGRKGKKLLKDILDNHVILEFQITSNVRLNNLNTLKKHPLKEYLAAGISCVQGTDGGALYGTDSVDEQLSLEKLLDLSFDEMRQMRQAEDRIIASSMEAFRKKKEAFRRSCGKEPVRIYYQERIKASSVIAGPLLSAAVRYDSSTELQKRIRTMPEDKYPIVIAGGSFNNDIHSTKVRSDCVELIDRMAEELDPSKVFFVVGDKLNGYERYLIRQCRGRFDIFAIIPTMISGYERNKLIESQVNVVISIEPTGMGLYKSFAYEIFKRRPSTVVAFDGNASGANLIQEAKNGRYKAQIFVSETSRGLRPKAESLRGYVRLFGPKDDILPEIKERIETSAKRE